MPKFTAEHLELLKRHLTAENAHDLKGRCGHLKPWGVFPALPKQRTMTRPTTTQRRGRPSARVRVTRPK
jgi:hypothetical protein